jgi:hypothetical protein
VLPVGLLRLRLISDLDQSYELFLLEHHFVEHRGLFVLTEVQTEVHCLRSVLCTGTRLFAEFTKQLPSYLKRLCVSILLFDGADGER